MVSKPKPKAGASDSATLKAFAKDFVRFAGSMLFPSPKHDGELRPFAESWAPFQKDLIAALAPALLAVSNRKVPPSNYWVEWPKGCGKDQIASLSVLFLARFSKRKLTIQVAACDKDQAAELRKSAEDWMSWNPWLSKEVKVAAYRIWNDTTNVECEIIPTDVASSHGARPDYLIANEITHATRWEFIETLLDNSTKVVGGLVLVCTNAGFVNSDAWRWRELFRESPRWSFLQHTAPGPWVSESAIDEARMRNPPSRFARLFEGIWSAGSGDALDPENVAACTRADLQPHFQRIQGWRYVAGLDLSVRRDFSSLVVLGRPSKSEIVQLVNVQVWKPTRIGKKVIDIDLTSICIAIEQAHRAFRLSSLRYDPFQAALMSQMLKKIGVPMVEVPMSSPNLKEMASILMQSFADKSVLLYPDPKLIADLLRLMLIERADGFRLDAVRNKDGHADAATAFALALPGAKALPMNSGGQWDGPVNVPAGGLTNSMSPNRSSHDAIYGRFGGTPQIHWGK